MPLSEIKDREKFYERSDFDWFDLTGPLLFSEANVYFR